ncbi:MAG: PHP domain-containing protein [bacterium]|nr:PHP domain-containing protein [bacterium]
MSSRKKSTTISNQEIAQLLRHVAAVYIIQDANKFRIRAYDTAANSIEQLSIPLKELWADGELDSVPGLGEKIRGALEELFTTGEIPFFQEVLGEVPAGMFPLVDLSGIGPKIAYKLATTLELDDATTALAKVKVAAEAGQLAELPGISTILEKKILDLVSQPPTPASQQRMLLATGFGIARDIIEYLLSSPAVLVAEGLGSMRRRSPTVGDIDIAVSTRDSAAVAAHLEKYPQLSKFISKGDKTIAIRLKAGLRIDIKCNPPEQWGSLLQHYTGSKAHNIHLRTVALEKGLSLSEFGIKHGSVLKSYASEEKFYQALGLQWVPPELREDNGEVEAALKHKLPQLVELSDIKGDLHIHTSIPFPTSHDLGASTVAEYLAAAEQLGYSYLGFSDHNPKRSDLSATERVAAIKQRNAAIDEAVAEYYQGKAQSIKVYKGLEVDILPSGELALEDEGLALLDYAIASVHSAFTQDRETATQRILKALAHPKVKILGHPTGRLINKREGVAADWELIADFCAEHNKYLEINASSDRLDLPFDVVNRVRQKKVQFFINTDSHHQAALHSMQYGVWMARKGWLMPTQVANTKSSPW